MDYGTFATIIIGLLVFAAVSCSAQCRNNYIPSSYRGHTRVPPNCAVATPSRCPRSWKAGVSGGKSTELPLIDTLFVTCHEGTSQCGYVPINSATGEVAGNSGVTIGAGVDLGSKNRTYFTFIGVTSTTLLNNLEPYFGLTGDAAACAVLERPLQVTVSEANYLTDRVKDSVATSVEQRYAQDQGPNALPFRSLPRGVRTAVSDVWFQFGLPSAYPRFWEAVTRNDWRGAVMELRNFYRNPTQQLRGDLKRRNAEADIIEATYATCNRSIDAVFLLDESGSVSSSDFLRAKNFVSSVLRSFPDDHIGGTNGTRFGLSAFSSSYRSIFYLSTYSTKSQYLRAIDRVTQRSGGTRLGSALYSVLRIQFTVLRGLRPETEGLPRILIVLTDGESSDSVATPAKNIRNQNIVVYAIGIGGYDLTQLTQIASSPAHVIQLGSFFDLDDFAATLTASTCNEPQPVSLRKKISGNVQKSSFQYYKFNISDRGSNLKVELSDTQGKTLMYASRDNPHPYQYDNTFGFSSSSASRKTIVISPTSLQSSNNGLQTSNNQFVYISVTADTDTASYMLEGTACDVSECSKGISGASTLQMPIFATIIAIMAFLFELY